MDQKQIEANLKNHDNAFLNSIVSYGIYTSREWIFGNSKIKDEEHFLNLLKSANRTLLDSPIKKAYELYISFYSRNTFQSIKLNIAEKGEYYSHTYGYNTKFKIDNGKYEALDNLAKAGVYRTKNEDGSYNLHLSFRGTDTDARSFSSFLGKAYLDMSAYYDAFKPLEMAVLDYAKDPANKIKELHVSGHSLGGSMVQEFFDSPNVKSSALDLKGFTFGAPGSKKHKLYSFLPALYHTVKHQKFLDLGKAALNFMMLDEVKKVDDRITQYTHSGDLIPKVSIAAYSKVGNHVHLDDSATNNLKENYILTGKFEVNCGMVPKKEDANPLMKLMIATQYLLITKSLTSLKRSFTFQSHDMLRYILNIDTFIKKEYNAVKGKEPSQLTPHLANFTAFRQRFEKNTFLPAQDLITKNMIEHLKQPSNDKKPVTVIPKALQAVLAAQNKIRNAVMLKQIGEDLTGKPVGFNFVSAKTGNTVGKI